MAELGTAMRSLGSNPTETELRDMINEVDSDGNGTLEFTEFCNLMTRTLSEASGSNQENELRERFKLFDKNNDGTITREELAQCMAQLGEKLREEDINEMMDDADKNGDGLIDY